MPRAVILALPQPAQPARRTFARWPGPLVPLGNRPLLHHAMGCLRDAGIREVAVVSDASLGRRLRSSLADGAPWDVRTTHVLTTPGGELAALDGLSAFLAGDIAVVHRAEALLGDGLSGELDLFASSGADARVLARSPHPGDVAPPGEAGAGASPGLGIELLAPGVLDRLRTVTGPDAGNLDSEGAVGPPSAADRGVHAGPHDAADRGAPAGPHDAADRGAPAGPHDTADRGAPAGPHDTADRGAPAGPHDTADRGAPAGPHNSADRGGSAEPEGPGRAPELAGTFAVAEGRPGTLVAALVRLATRGARVERRAVASSWVLGGSTDEVLEGHRFVLDAIEPAWDPGVLRDGRIEGRVVIDPSSVVERSLVRGPAIIGPGVHVRDAYVGPYTALGAGSCVENAEIEHSLVLREVLIRDVAWRLERSIVGDRTRIARSFRLPQAVSLCVGEDADISVT